jgi:CBS domain containing-hemolysin-like protein
MLIFDGDEGGAPVSGIPGDGDSLDSDPFPPGVNMVIIALLIFVNGFFVSAEWALVKVRGTRIDALAQSGSKRAALALHVTNNPDAYLFACQLGITLASLGLGWLGGPAIARLIEPLFVAMHLGTSLVNPLSFLIGFSIIALLHIVVGELMPKSVATRKSETVALLVAWPLYVFRKLMSPFIWLLNKTANALLRPLGLRPNGSDELNGAHSEEEIRNLVKESHKSGLIDNTELTLVDNIFDFADTNAREIMIPRTDICCLYANMSFAENKEIALREMHTRYPVCENDKDNIIGFIHIKDLLKVPDHAQPDIRDLVRPITSVPESMPISVLLKLMQKRKTQIALLIDEYGGTAGLVTLEDIMEEIVGEIQDEFDEERPEVEKLEDGTYSISGLLLIEEVNSLFNLDIPTEDYDTIGGWIYSQIEIPPKKDQTVETGNGAVRFTIEETDHLRITRLKVTCFEAENWNTQAETG